MCVRRQKNIKTTNCYDQKLNCLCASGWNIESLEASCTDTTKIDCNNFELHSFQHLKALDMRRRDIRITFSASQFHLAQTRTGALPGTRCSKSRSAIFPPVRCKRRKNTFFRFRFPNLLEITLVIVFYIIGEPLEVFDWASYSCAV